MNLNMSISKTRYMNLQKDLPWSAACYKNCSFDTCGQQCENLLQKLLHSRCIISKPFCSDKLEALESKQPLGQVSPILWTYHRQIWSTLDKQIEDARASLLSNACE